MSHANHKITYSILEKNTLIVLLGVTYQSFDSIFQFFWSQITPLLVFLIKRNFLNRLPHSQIKEEACHDGLIGID